MKKFFGVLYALYGCGWAVLASRVQSVSLTLLMAGLAAVCFFAASQAFFGSGLAWRIVHVSFGAVTLLLWVLCSAYFLVYVVGWVRAYDMGTLAPLLGGFVGLVLTGPAIAYMRALVLWRRARARGVPLPDGGRS